MGGIMCSLHPDGVQRWSSRLTIFRKNGHNLENEFLHVEKKIMNPVKVLMCFILNVVTYKINVYASCVFTAKWKQKWSSI